MVDLSLPNCLNIFWERGLSSVYFLIKVGFCLLGQMVAPSEPSIIILMEIWFNVLLIIKFKVSNGMNAKKDIRI